MNKVVLDFYDQLQHDEELKNKIAKEVLLSRAKNNNLTVEEELNKIVIPIAKEHGFNLSAKDIIDYEKKYSFCCGMPALSCGMYTSTNGNSFTGT